jgi:hypothetical protein
VKALLALALIFGLGGVIHTRVAPHIVTQRTDTVSDDMGSLIWERYIDIRNPLDRAVWVYLECDVHLTVNPVSVSARHTSEITLDNVAPKEQCEINHWAIQVPGKSPEPWRP